jgi:hypothetical protein
MDVAAGLHDAVAISVSFAEQSTVWRLIDLPVVV